MEHSGTLRKLTIIILVFFATLGSSKAQFYDSHSLAICSNGDLLSFGRNENCQLGWDSGTTTKIESPETTSGITNVVAVAAGGRHSLALLDNGDVLAWGLNNSGCAGEPTSTIEVCSPKTIPLSGCAVAVSAGLHFSMALLADGTIWTWGLDNTGQLGDDGTNTTTHIPQQVSGISNAIAISAGTDFAVALLND